MGLVYKFNPLGGPVITNNVTPSQPSFLTSQQWTYVRGGGMTGTPPTDAPPSLDSVSTITYGVAGHAHYYYQTEFLALFNSSSDIIWAGEWTYGTTSGIVPAGSELTKTVEGLERDEYSDKIGNNMETWYHRMCPCTGYEGDTTSIFYGGSELVGNNEAVYTVYFKPDANTAGNVYPTVFVDKDTDKYIVKVVFYWNDNGWEHPLWIAYQVDLTTTIDTEYSNYGCKLLNMARYTSYDYVLMENYCSNLQKESCWIG